MEQLNKIGVNVVRYIVSLIFIFSGFVKIVDPMGFFYKLKDYVVAFNIDIFPDFILLSSSFMLSALEFLIGLYLFFGVRRRISIFISMILMFFMTPLTLVLAVLNPISDCGCFGDALVLTNWETFIKNIFLLLFIIYLYKFDRKIIRFFSIEANWIVSMYSVFFIFVLGIYSLYYLPIIDFRPYKIGTDIVKDMSIPTDAEEPEYETLFVLEKDNVQEKFTLDNYPDSTWTYVNAETKLIKPGYIPPIQGFSISNIETGEDLTDSILANDDYYFVLIAHQIAEADDSNIDLINEIYDYSVDHGYSFICLTSSSDDDIETWRDKTGAEYPFYGADDIVLKTVIRSNPGLILMKNGVIYNKWDHHSLPDEYQLNGPIAKTSLANIATQETSQVLVIVLAWYFIPLLILFGIDKLLQLRRLKRTEKE